MAEEKQPSKQSIANRENGRRGGLATAQSHDQNWLEARASKGGEALRTLYSSDYFRHLNGLRKTKGHWPKAKSRTVANKVKEEIESADLSTSSKITLTEMLATN